MGYNIEISFDIYKNSSVTNLKYELIEIAEKNHCNPICENIHIDYEMENGFTQNEKRNHCIMTFNFDNSRIMNFIKFLNRVKKLKPFHIESIYHDEDSKIIYASKYYQSLMNKNILDKYKILKNDTIKELNSSDNLILLSIKK